MTKRKRKILGVIIARQGSSRLPGKGLIEIEGKPIVGHIVDRIRGCELISDVMIATSTNAEDDALERYGERIGVKVFRGHSDDVLARLYHAAEKEKPDAVIEVGGDCPLVCPELFESGIKKFDDNPKADLVTNFLIPPFTYPVGYDFIMLKFSALKKAHLNARLSSERYQPFQYMIKNSKDYKIVNFTLEKNYNHWRWTLDYPEDLDFMKAVWKGLYLQKPLFGFNELKTYLNKNPNIISLNAKHAEQVVGNLVWFTGSFVKEVHSDIQALLLKAKKLEEKGGFLECEKVYSEITELVQNLKERSKIKGRKC
jgi:spore coat polysaccharide biosynthesis protein SpsF